MIITIDGPAGSGKSTIAKEIAKRLGFLHLNSGLLYRALAKTASDLKISNENSGELAALAADLRFDFTLNLLDFTTNTKINYLKSDLNLDPEILLSEEWSQAASKVGVFSTVREVLTQTQREIGINNNLVLEGRDSGSVVFPKADFKFYLKAPLSERVKRRVAQEIGDKKISQSDYKEIESAISEEIQLRDHRDSSREASPHVIPLDAKVIETGELNIFEVVEELVKEIEINK